jgi:hypothetical protein
MDTDRLLCCACARDCQRGMRLDTALSASMSTLGARGALPEAGPPPVAELWIIPRHPRAPDLRILQHVLDGAGPQRCVVFLFPHFDRSVLDWLDWPGRLEQHPPEDLR